jgi:hypothetical protein
MAEASSQIIRARYARVCAAIHTKNMTIQRLRADLTQRRRRIDGTRRDDHESPSSPQSFARDRWITLTFLLRIISTDSSRIVRIQRYHVLFGRHDASGRNRWMSGCRPCSDHWAEPRHVCASNLLIRKREDQKDFSEMISANASAWFIRISKDFHPENGIAWCEINSILASIKPIDLIMVNWTIEIHFSIYSPSDNTWASHEGDLELVGTHLIFQMCFISEILTLGIRSRDSNEPFHLSVDNAEL